MNFDDLGLMPSLLKAVKEKGYEVPSPIQEKAIPLILKGRDILASAQTGTGKTAGFTLPLLQRLSENEPKGKRNIRALILTPTRELAAQIYDNVLEYSKHINLRSTVIFGGVNQRPQVATLRQGVDILIATPGRLLDLVNQRVLFLDNVETYCPAISFAVLLMPVNKSSKFLFKIFTLLSIGIFFTLNFPFFSIFNLLKPP